MLRPILGIDRTVDRSDAGLLSAAARGDADAFAEFFRRHVRAVTAYAVRRCSNNEDVADLVSETFLAALQASGRYRPESDTALPWVFGIARRVLARQRRTRAGANRVMQKVANVSPHYQGAEDDAIAAAVDAARHAPHIEAALDTLSRGERDVLELVAYQGLTPREAAIALDLTANAARLKLSRARKRVRQHLSETPGLERLEPGTRHAL